MITNHKILFISFFLYFIIVRKSIRTFEKEMTVSMVTRKFQPMLVVVERNICNTLLTSSGYCTNNAMHVCPASFVCTSQVPGIFPAIIKE
jgi:hypothetical protein